MILICCGLIELVTLFQFNSGKAVWFRWNRFRQPPIGYTSLDSAILFNRKWGFSRNNPQLKIQWIYMKELINNYCLSVTSIHILSKSVTLFKKFNLDSHPFSCKVQFSINSPHRAKWTRCNIQSSVHRNNE